ncbi:hypothetical protein ACFQ4C_20020 [Larkinella insperata]|uniref:Uncharacterized protein n=1 Tax=Larkinella insperata TaxID=332158 RepID=A0ABW3Q9P7_9BACT|nr:hypothetical protein [Larkinella insperata]
MNRALKVTALVLALSSPALAGTSSHFPEPGDEKEKVASTSPNVSRTKSMGVAIYRSINSAKMNLLIENYIEVPLQVSLLDEKNEVLHTEKVSKRLKKYWRKFDMETMKDGLYTFQISDGLNKVTKSFKLETTKAEVKEPARFVSLLD